MTNSLDAELSWLVKRSGIRQSSPERRLNAIENALANLGVRWRVWAPLAPERELRMSELTRDQLLAWVEEREKAPVSGPLRERIDVYRSDRVVEPSLAAGWIRLLV